jgi:hypothetical protein
MDTSASNALLSFVLPVEVPPATRTVAAIRDGPRAMRVPNVRLMRELKLLDRVPLAPIQARPRLPILPLILTTSPSTKTFYDGKQWALDEPGSSRLKVVTELTRRIFANTRSIAVNRVNIGSSSFVEAVTLAQFQRPIVDCPICATSAYRFSQMGLQLYNSRPTSPR